MKTIERFNPRAGGHANGHTGKQTMHPTRNTLNPAVRRQAIGLLNQAVADLFDLYARIKQAHWNVRGDSFFALHKLLDEFAATTSEHIDTAAERATALGGIVEGTLRLAVKESRLKKQEQPTSKSGQRDWLHELAEVHAACGKNIRTAADSLDEAGDPASTDLLVDILRDLDKQLWILEAHLNR